MMVFPVTRATSASTLPEQSTPLVIQTVDAAPLVPSLGASASTWQNFASEWNSALTSGASSITWEGHQCPVNSMVLVPVSESAAAVAGIPDGASLDGFAFNLDCAITSTTSTSLSSSEAGGVRPLTSPGTGSTCGAVGGATSYGTQCTFPCTVDGDGAACTTFYNSSPAFYGHVALSGDGIGATSCSVGSGEVDNSNQNQLDGNTYGVGEIVDVSNVWNGNDWKGTSSPWTNLGNICSAF